MLVVVTSVEGAANGECGPIDCPDLARTRIVSVVRSQTEGLAFMLNRVKAVWGSCLREPLFWLLAVCFPKIVYFFSSSLVAIDDMRQFGPALAATVGGDTHLLSQPQIAYYASVSPAAYRWLLGLLWSAASMVSLVALMKLVAVLLFVITVAAIIFICRSLFESGLTRSLFEFFLCANLLMTAQVLSGTPRDLGSALLAWAIVFWIKRGWLAWGACLLLLSGLYPLYGVLLLVAVSIWVLLFDEEGVPALGVHALEPRRLSLVLIGAGLAYVGFKLLGPAVASDFGPVLEIFKADYPRVPLGYPIDAFAFAKSVLGDGNFSLVVSPSRAPLQWGLFGWVVVLFIFSCNSVGLVGWRLPWRAVCRSRRWVAFSASLLASCWLLYGVSIFVAFRLHAPSRFTGIAWVVVFAAVETALALGFWRLSLRRVLLVSVSIGLCFLALPVGGYELPAGSIQQLRDLGLEKSEVNVLALGKGRDNSFKNLSNSLPLFLGWRSYYLSELDRGYHVNVILRNQKLARSSRQLDKAASTSLSDQRLIARLHELKITHLLVDGKMSQSMPDAVRLCSIKIHGTGPVFMNLVTVDCLSALKR